MARIPIEKWFSWIQEQILSRTITDSADIKASRGKTGTQLFLQKNSGGGEEGGSATATATGYDGPWRFIRKDETTFTLLGFHSLNNVVLTHNYIYFSSTRKELLETDITIPLTVQDINIYLKLSNISGAYNLSLEYFVEGAGHPSDVLPDHQYYPLVYIPVNDGSSEDIIQIQYGQIYGKPGVVYRGY